MSKIVIAGASGFVGQALIKNILETSDHEIVALSRNDKISNSPRLKWIQCDLFSLLDTERALAGSDIAIYLVHSMIPSARLTQGKFQDFDLLLADNFSRGCQKSSIKQIIYLGGIVPKNNELSMHIKSRLEVEQILRASGVALTSLRAGLIIGSTGSSFTMMKKLVQRLSIMICPNWTSSVSSPIALKDVTHSISYLINHQQSFNNIYDLCSGELYSYRDLMKILAQELGLKRKFFSVNLFTPKLSRLWVSLVTGAPKSLVAPLVESLKTSMRPDGEKALKIPNYHFQSYRDTLREIIHHSSSEAPHAYKYTGNIKEKSLVRSLQRFTLHYNQNAREIASRYFGWLPHFFYPFVRVIQNDEKIDFRFLYFREPLLSLEYSQSRSSLERQLFYVVGGMLAAKTIRARLEFRRTLNREHIICAIHDFKPKLPWYIYKYTQAIVHLLVMKKFRHYLQGKS